MTGQGAKPSGWDAAAAGAGALVQADAVFDGDRMRPGAVLRVEGGQAHFHDGPVADLPLWRAKGTLAPGFVDLQVNGGGGVLFNTSPTPEGLLAIARAHRSTGTAAFLPTLITDTPKVMTAAAHAILPVLGQQGIVGLHLEGPHISPVRRGTHAAVYVRPLDAHTLAIAADLRAKDVPLMLTLAPEAVQPGQIAQLVGQGVIVALGHSDADADRVQAALTEGAQTFTHLFNAMSQMTGRAPGMVGAALNSQAYASLICDGIHVAPDMLRLALRARPRNDRMIIVTDAMPTVAGPPEYDLYGNTIRLRDGRLVNAEGALAGAHVTMLQSVRYAISELDQTPEAALRMAITHPAQLMQMGGLAVLDGRRAEDVLLIEPDWMIARFLQ